MTGRAIGAYARENEMLDEAAALTPPQVAELLRSTATTISAELRAVPAVLAGWHPAPGEWCMKEALGHIIEAERRGFAGRVRILLQHDQPDLATWDQVAIAQQRRDCQREVADLLREFAELRDASVTLVASLSVADLERAGNHPQVGYLRVNDVMQEWVHHDRNHVRQMLANVQSFVWPHMGSAQRFSDD